MTLRRPILLALAAVLALLLAACSNSSEDAATAVTETTAADTGTGDGETDASGAAAAGTADESLLLNCGGTIDADVPAFYADYFRCVDISMDSEVVVISSANQPPRLARLE